MSCKKTNQSQGLSYGETSFLNSKSSKGKDCLFLFKGGWSLLSLTLKSLLLVVRIEKSSKSSAWLQNKRCYLMADHHHPVSAKIPKCSHILTLKEV